MSTESKLHPLTSEQGFTAAQELVDDLGAFLTQSNIEGLKNSPYLDSKDIPSIGIGINLRAYEAIYFDVLGIKYEDNGPGDAERAAMHRVIWESYANSNTSTLVTNLTSVMAAYPVKSPNLSNSQVVELFKDVLLGEGNSDTNNPLQGSQLAGYEKFLSGNNIQTGTAVTSSNFSGSLEGLAILSLYYNNPGTLLPSTGHLVRDLNQNNFNRADAWFQIRYGSNGGYKSLTTTDPQGGGFNGVADRRYLESTFFGLYGDGVTTPSLDDATKVYAELSDSTNGTSASSPTGEMTNRQFAIAYENRYSGEISVGNDTVLSGQNGLQHFEAGDAVNQLTGLTVETLEDELRPAFNTLWQQYLGDTTLNPFAAGYAGANTVDPLDLQVALAQGGSDLIASERDGYWLDQGSYLPSVLIGQNGDDTLDGSGSGNDALIGRSGDDVIFVGSGNDYIVAGTGDDVIGSKSSDGSVGSMGGGNDTVVLGDAGHAKGGHDTVFSGSGADTYYLAAGDSDVIYLNAAASAQPVFELVGANGSLTSLSIDATAVAGTSGVYFDQAKNTLVLESPGANGTYSVKVIGLGSGGVSPQAMTIGAKSFAMSTNAVQSQLNASPLSGGYLELNNFQGSSDAGITLANDNATTPGAGNLAQFSATTYGTTTEYRDLSASGGGDSMDGVNTSGSSVNILEGEGNASYLYAGNGNNEVFATDVRYSPVGMVFTTPVQVMIQGGSGNQLLVGVGDDGSNGNAQETILGGAMGQDTTAYDTIDGGGAFVNALLAGGSQNSLIFGGIGTDTIMAGSAASGSTQPAPATIAIAGVSYWAAASQTPQGGGSVTVTGEPRVSIPTFSDPGNFQIDIALNQLDGSYAAPFGLLGSSSDSGTDDNGGWKLSSDPSWTLPGSLMIGGNGQDYLIGNSGNDTIIGGTPLKPVSGQIDEALVGAGGANLIYGGGGTELIYADLGPGDDSNWANLNPNDADTIYGGSGNDYIYGSGGNDLIYGESGNYTIYTGNGNAYVETGSGNTIVNGGKGNDTIIAGSGSDSITTGDGNDSIYSGDGQSTITLGAGNDTVAVGAGATLYHAGTGQETYSVGAGAGNQTIQGSASASAVNLEFADSSGDVIARDDLSGDLILTNESSGSQVQVSGYFSGQSNVSVSFGDGVTWSAAQILQQSMTPAYGNDLLIGSDGSDTITGGPGDDTIIGVKGNNVLTGGSGASTIQGGSGTDTIEGGTGAAQIEGGAGSETYVFNLGDGSDTITENAASGTDLLKFGSGITASDVTFSYGASPSDLLITFGSLTDSSITISGFFSESASQHRVDNFQFSDGTSISHDQVIPLAEDINGTSGNDTLRGTGGVNSFDGKGGNDFESGNSLSDTFVFDSGYGHLEIYEDSDASKYTPVLKFGEGITASSLRVTSNGSDLYITDGISGDQIFLPSGLYADWGVREVQFADGTSLTKGQLMQIAADDASTTGSDMIYGSVEADLYDGRGGDDTISGGGGDDTFIFNEGYGHLTISDSAVQIDLGYDVKQQAMLKLGAGITVSSLHVTAGGGDTIDGNDDMYLTDGVGGDLITLKGMFYNSSANQGVQLVELADGTTLTQAQLIQMELSDGTAGDDTLHGGQGSDLIDGKGGDDVEDGFGGNDTFVFDAGYGKLTILNNYGTGQKPILQLGAGISASSLHVMSDGVNIYITDGVAGDLIELEDKVIIPDNTGVSAVELSDGTQIADTQLMQMIGVPSGTTGNDSLYGAGGSEYFDGKGGGDYESGGGGSDTFVFDQGYGKLEVNEQYASASSEVPVLKLGAGITASSLMATTNGTDIFLTDGISGDQIALDGAYASNGSSGVAKVQFADGTTLTAAQLEQMVYTPIVGTAGSDTLTGTAGADRIDGKGGNDTVIGNGGNDTFAFDVGYGQLDIQEQYTSGQTPVLQLGTGITTSNLKVTPDASGSGLVLTDGTSGDQITLEGVAFDDSKYGVQEVKLADGTTLTAAQLLQMETSLPGNGGSVTGGSGSDTLVADTANESLIGGSGSEVFDFNTGFGQDTVVANGSATSNTILFGAGITSSNLNFSTDGSELTITDTSSNGADGQASSIVLPGHFVNGNPVTDVGELLFNDGSYITMDQINQLFASAPAPAPAPAPSTVLTAGADNTLVSDNGVDLLQANAGDDTLTGGSGTDTLESGVGNTLMNGGSGTETYLFNTGFGQDTVVANGSATSNTILFGAGITSSNLNFSTDGSELTITDTSSTGSDGQASSIVLPGHFVNGNPVTDVGELLFNDGSYITMDQINQLFAPAPAPAPAASTAAAPMVAMTATKGSSAAPSTGAAAEPSHSPKPPAFGSHPWLATQGAGVYGPDLQGAGATESEWMRQINTLTHAIAGFTGGGAGMDTSMPITPAMPVDLMLHVAA